MNENTQQTGSIQNESFELTTIVKKNFFALTLQAISVVVLLANLWLATKLAPLAEGLREVKTAQAQQEMKIEEHDNILDRFLVVEEKVRSIETTTRETQTDVRTLLINNARGAE